MKVAFYCISLPSSIERRSLMQAQFKKLGLQVSFVDGVYFGVGDDYPEGYDRPLRLHLQGRDLSRGEIGCYLAHRKAWEVALERGDQYSCFLEDDLILEDNFLAVIKILLEKKLKWDIIRLCERPNEHFRRPSGWVVSQLDEKQSVKNYLKQPLGTQGYIVKNSALEDLLRFTSSYYDAIDNMINFEWEHGMRLFALSPGILSENLDLTTTISDRGKDKLKFPERIKKEFRRMPWSFKKIKWRIYKFIVIKNRRNQ